MTISNQTNRISAVGNGAVGQEVPFGFPITATSDMTVISRVTATGVETDLVETTNYTIVIDGDSGGTLTTVTAISTDDEIHLIRATPFTQNLDLEQGGNFNAENLEDAVDKTTKLAIDNKDNADRSLRAPATDAVTLDLEIPNSVDRASKNLGFDSGGNVTVTDSSGNFSTTNAFWDDVIIKSPIHDVRAYGAVGDGVTSDNAAISIAATAAAGGTLMFPAGTYLIDADITIGATVQLLFLAGASLSVDIGMTFTIAGEIEAGRYQIFDGAGDVAFSEEVQTWKPEWFAANTGVENTFNGFEAGEDFTSGRECTFNGFRAGRENTSGLRNTYTGAEAGESNLTGNTNSAYGVRALRENLATANNAFGYRSLENNTTGDENSGFSSGTLRQNTTGANNSAFGRNAINANVDGSNNNAFGKAAMLESTSTENSIAIGNEALHGNIAGEQILDGDFSVTDLPTGWTLGAGWAVDNVNNEVDKNAAGVGTLTATLTDGGAAYIDYGVGSTYTILYTVDNWTVGGVTVSFGGVSDTERTADGDYTFNVTPTSFSDAGRLLTFTPSGATTRLSITDVSLTGTSTIDGVSNTAVGIGALYMMGSGDNNVGMGVGALRQNGEGSTNTALGTESFRQGGGSGNVGLGNRAGYYETASNRLVIDNVPRSSESDGRAKSLITGIFASTVAEQEVTINASFHADRICFVDDEIVSLDNNLVSV